MSPERGWGPRPHASLLSAAVDILLGAGGVSADGDPSGLAPFEPTARFGAAMTGYFSQPDGHTPDELWRECVLDLDGLRERMGERWHDMKRYDIDRARTPAVTQAQQTFMDEFVMKVTLPKVLAAMSVPTIVIWGRHDAIVNPAVGEEASRRYGWPLHVIDAGNELRPEVCRLYRRTAPARHHGSSTHRVR